jgi:hypothetical protein
LLPLDFAQVTFPVPEAVRDGNSLLHRRVPVVVLIYESADVRLMSSGFTHWRWTCAHAVAACRGTRTRTWRAKQAVTPWSSQRLDTVQQVIRLATFSFSFDGSFNRPINYK